VPTADRVLIIIPALNESESIGKVVAEVRAELPTADVLVIDDGSTDDTAGAARSAGATVAMLPYNLGVGGAMRLGYRYAADHHYDAAVQIDADGQHDPRYVPRMLEALTDDVDLVIGARFAGEGDYTVRGPRKWAMRLLSVVLSRLARTRLTDTTSGLRAANAALIKRYARWYPVEYLGDTVESTVWALRQGFRVRQVPVSMRVRMAGVPSHSPLKAGIYLFRAILTLFLAFLRS
jgi:glycosyltransferase involved in cell wall biosynthesis